MEQLALQIMDFIKDTSPIVWQAIIRQVYVDAFGRMAWAIITSVLFVSCLYVGRALARTMQNDRWDDTDYDLLFAVTCIIAIVSFLITIYNAIVSMQMIANPTYYALDIVKDLLLK
jgi:hypothetical protein